MYLDDFNDKGKLLFQDAGLRKALRELEPRIRDLERVKPTVLDRIVPEDQLPDNISKLEGKPVRGCVVSGDREGAVYACGAHVVEDFDERSADPVWQLESFLDMLQMWRAYKEYFYASEAEKQEARDQDASNDRFLQKEYKMGMRREAPKRKRKQESESEAEEVEGDEEEEGEVDFSRLKEKIRQMGRDYWPSPNRRNSSVRCSTAHSKS